MNQYQQLFREKIEALQQHNNYRYFLQVKKSAAHFPAFYYEYNGETRRAINFCSNDYLGMSVDEEVMGKLSIVVHQSGTGSGGTRNISGTTIHHHSLEQTIASWHRKENALLFSGAYLANLTTLQTIGRHIKDLIFISDERNHASLIEGMRSAGNNKKIFRHNDITHLEEIVASLPVDQPKMIVFESVYSMNGSVAPLKQISSIAKQYNALTYVDEVHAIGMYGATGAGIIEQEQLSNEIDIINGTLAKAIGVIGGYITASETIIDFVRSYGSGFIFTTSLPPAVCAAAEKSIRQIMLSQERRAVMRGLVNYLRRELTAAGVSYISNESHITPVVIPGAKHCKRVADALLNNYGMYAQPLNFPTVPEGEECLRIIVTAKHTREHVSQFVNSLKQVLIEETAHHMQKQPA